MSTRQIASSTLWQLFSQVTMAALSILTVKFVAIGLTKELAGIYNSAYGFLQLFGILADFGLYAVAVREVSKAEKKGEILGALIVLRTGILLVSLLSALAIVWVIPAWKGTPLPLSVTIAALVPFFTLLAGIIRTVFQVSYAMHYVFIAEVLQRIFTTAAIGAFIVVGIRGSHDLQILHMFLFFGGVGAFLLLLLSAYYANRFIVVRLSFHKEMLKDLLKKAAPYGLAFLCMALYRQFDLTMIALLREDFETQNAYYGFVVRMTDMGFLIPTFLLNSTLPMLSERESNGEDTRSLLGKTFLIILILGSISSLFSLLWARPLIELLTTSQYLSTAHTAGSDTALQLLSIPLLLNGIVLYSFYVLLTKHVWKKLVSTLCIGSVLSVGLNLWLIPTYGFVGSAYASIAVHALLAVLLFTQAQRAMPLLLSKETLGRWLLFSVLLGALLWTIRPYLSNEMATVIGLVAGTICIGIALLLTNLPKKILSPL